MGVVKQIDIKNRIFYFYNDIIDLKNFDARLLKTDKKSYKNIDIYYIGYITPRKHSSWWTRLEELLKTFSSLSSEDVLMKTNIFLLIIRLPKTSWSIPIYSSCLYIFKSFWRRLQDVFKTSSRRLANTSWRHLQDVLKTYHQVKLFLLTSLWEVFNMFVRRTAKTIVYSRI